MRISDWSSDVCSSDLGLKAGTLDGISIGYRARKFTNGTKAGEPRRKLHEVDLVEASIVTFPANDKARVGSVKSAEIDTIETLSDAAAFLREAGGQWSKKAARDFVSRLSRIARRARKRVVEGKSGAGRVDLGCCRYCKKKKSKENKH